ncbi:MAG: MarR family winged helix-turn-helix transcriptional regulator [Rubricella sp.]
MSSDADPVSVALLSEIHALDTLAKARLQKALPKGMDLSHFIVLNHFARLGGERTPAQLAKIFHVTRGTMTNTLGRLERAGYVHIRPDWEDGRKKWVSISPAGRQARDYALALIQPVFASVLDSVGKEDIRAILPILRRLRGKLTE